MNIKVADIIPTLWPKASYSGWFVSGARQRAEAAYGKDPVTGVIYDVGALRDTPNGAEVRTPPDWMPYNHREHHFIASVYNRVGPGWSFSSNSVHNAGKGWFIEVFKRNPNLMENVDAQFSKGIYEALRRIAIEGSTEAPPVFDKMPGAVAPKPSAGTSPTPTPQPLPSPPTIPTPKPKPTPIPDPPVVISLPSVSGLSAVSVRVEELKNLLLSLDTALPSWIHSLLQPAAWTIIKPIAEELLTTYRKVAGKSLRE